MRNLKLSSDPPQRDFTIKTLEEGDIVAGIDFVLKPARNEVVTQQKISPEPKPVVPKGIELKIPQAENPVMKEEKKDPVYDTLFKVQLLALRTPIKVKDYFKQILAAIPGLTITETSEDDGFYHYSAQSLRSKAEAKELMRIIRKSGWKDCFIATYYSVKRTHPLAKPKSNK